MCVNKKCLFCFGGLLIKGKKIFFLVCLVCKVIVLDIFFNMLRVSIFFEIFRLNDSF